MTNFSAPEIGDALPTVKFGPISRTILALYAGASGDHNPIHIDSDFARAAGCGDVFAHGMLSYAVLTRCVTEWAGLRALRRITARFVSITDLGEKLLAEGKVIEALEEEGERRLRISITMTANGRQTLVGEAVVAHIGATSAN